MRLSKPRRDHRPVDNRVLWTVLAAMFVALSSLTWFQVSQSRAESERRADALEETVAQSTQQTRDLIAQVQNLGSAPVVTPEEVPDVDVPDSVAEGVSTVSITRAVDDYFSRFPIARDVRSSVSDYLRANPPAAGRPPTDQEIALATAQYLDENPPPPGENGRDGRDGAPGQDGTNGTAGRDGRSVTGVQLAECNLVFSYDDSTVSTVGPVCGARGPEGPAGPPGVVNVGLEEACSSGEGDLAEVGLTYEASTQTLTLTCEREGGLLDPPVETVP